MKEIQTKNESRYAALLMDCGFKAVFGDERNKDVVISLLNRFLDGEHHIVEIEFLNNEQMGETFTTKGVRYDLHCKDDTGARFVVEMQKIKNSQDFYTRSVYYGSKVYSLQHNKGKKRYNLSPVYVLGIMEGQLAHVTDSKCIVRYTMARKDVDEIAPKTIICTFVQLGFFSKRSDECVDMLDQWLYSLKHMDALDEVPDGFDSEEMSSLYTAAEIALFDGDKRIKYEKAMMYERDYNNDMYYSRKEGIEEGIAIGEAKGVAKGKEEEKISAARNFKKLGVSVETISQALELSPEEIEAL